MAIVLLFPVMVLAVNTYTLDLEMDVPADYVYAPDLPLTGGALTFEAWYNPETTVGEDETIWGDNNGTTMAVRLIKSTGSDLIFQIRETTVKSCTITQNLDAGTWVHVAFVVDQAAAAGSRCIAYVNGSEVSSTDNFAGGNLDEPTNVFTIGNDTSLTAGRYYDGKIDDFRIWSDVRTPTEISDNYNCGLAGDEAGLLAYWKLENNDTDSGPNGYDLTEVNGPTFQSATVPFTDDCAGSAAFTATSTSIVGKNTTIRGTNATIIGY
jgi:hypothetical protein